MIKSPTLRAPISICKHLIGLGGTALALAGCSLIARLEAPKYPPPKFGPRSAIYQKPFERVWRAAQLALQSYPIVKNDMDTGVIETGLIHGDKAWNPPYDPHQMRGGRRYKLIVRAIKGRHEGHPAVKVSVLKDIQFQRDYFSSIKQLPSDGLEEKVILYRIRRELQIDQMLDQAYQKQEQSDDQDP